MAHMKAFLVFPSSCVLVPKSPNPGGRKGTQKHTAWGGQLEKAFHERLEWRYDVEPLVEDRSYPSAVVGRGGWHCALRNSMVTTSLLPHVASATAVDKHHRCDSRSPARRWTVRGLRTTTCPTGCQPLTPSRRIPPIHIISTTSQAIG